MGRGCLLCCAIQHPVRMLGQLRPQCLGVFVGAQLAAGNSQGNTPLHVVRGLCCQGRGAGPVRLLAVIELC